MKYDGNTKQTFGRGWALNRVFARLPVAASHATILYLIGDNLDAPAMVKRGAKRENLVGIDRDGGCVRRARADGHLAIEGNVIHALTCWPVDWPLHALVLDFNCGLDRPVLDLIVALHAPAVHRDAPVYVNLQRGRDWIGKLPEWKARPDLTRNRAVTLYACYETALTLGFPEQWDGIGVRRRARPLFAQPYRQSVTTMDGVVFTSVHPNGRAGLPLTYQGAPWFQPMRRRLAALRAVRTRRIRRSE